MHSPTSQLFETSSYFLASNIVAAMLVSPLMGPVMSITFGTIISDRELVVRIWKNILKALRIFYLF